MTYYRGLFADEAKICHRVVHKRESKKCLARNTSAKSVVRKAKWTAEKCKDMVLRYRCPGKQGMIGGEGLKETFCC